MRNSCRRKICRRFLGTPVFRSDHFYSRDESGRYQVHYCPSPGKPPYACYPFGEQDEEERTALTCFFLSGNEFRFGYSRMISDHIGMETLFLRKNCLMLHAALIRWQEKGGSVYSSVGNGKVYAGWAVGKIRRGGYTERRPGSGKKRRKRMLAGVWAFLRWFLGNLPQ